MIMKTIINFFRKYAVLIACTAVICGIICSCSDTADPYNSSFNKTEQSTFDASKPVTISYFTPEEGGLGSRLVIYGDNFGSDTSKINVSVGGIKSKVVSSTGKILYCIVMPSSDEGTVLLTVTDANGNSVTQQAEKKFNYIRKRNVSTFIGVLNERGECELKDGPFDDCGGIAKASWFSFDPKNRNHLYFLGDESFDEAERDGPGGYGAGGGPLRLIDFEKQEVRTIFAAGYCGLFRMRTITWTLGGDTMIIASDKGGDGDHTNLLGTRAAGFMDMRPFMATGTKQCNGSAIHPVNGELYYNSYSMGQFYRYDWKEDKREQLFSVNEGGQEYVVHIHPTGNYAYLVFVNQHFIQRMNYDWNEQKFLQPNDVCGARGQSGWRDGAGGSARLNVPYQGAFVKNPQYAGNDDEYDFYFCDRSNHCIRKLTPEGIVSTFAGRGSTGMNADPYGYIDGDLRIQARFNRPYGLIYDDIIGYFYIGDTNNANIRMITED